MRCLLTRTLRNATKKQCVCFTCDIIPPSTRGPHGRHKQHVYNVQPGRVLLVIPVVMINPLAQQLDGRLSSINLLRRHVQIIYKSKVKSHHTAPFIPVTLQVCFYPDVLKSGLLPYIFYHVLHTLPISQL